MPRNHNYIDVIRHALGKIIGIHLAGETAPTYGRMTSVDFDQIEDGSYNVTVFWNVGSFTEDEKGVRTWKQDRDHTKVIIRGVTHVSTHKAVTLLTDGSGGEGPDVLHDYSRFLFSNKATSLAVLSIHE